MTQPIVAYGRCEPNSDLQLVGRRHQSASIKKAVGESRINFELDVASGDSPLGDRPALMQQLHEAHRHGVSLCVESMDRIISGYNTKRIRQFKKAMSEFGVRVAVAHINPRFHRRIRRILAKPISPSQKRKALVQRVDQHLRWRHNTIYPAVRSPHDNKGLVPFRDLRNSGVYPALERCAKHLLELDADSRDFNWYLHGFLGAAFEHRTRLLGVHRRQDSEKLSYGMHPQHADMFRIIHELENRQLTTVDGRPKFMSNQRIADEMNRLGFRNLRGTLLARRTIFQIRRSAAYLGSVVPRNLTVHLSSPRGQQNHEGVRHKSE